MDTTPDLLKKLQLLEGAGDHKGINDLLNEEVLQQFNRADLYVCKATACNATNDFANAFRHAEQGVIMQSGGNAYYQRGIALFMLQNYKAAIRDFNWVLKTMDNELAYICRAVCWYRMSEFKNAMADYSAAISMNDKKEEYYYERGLCKINLHEYEAAITDFEEAILIKADYHEAYCDMGLAYFMLKRYDEALINFNKCLEINKSYSIAHYNKGLYYHWFKDYDKAIENYTKALENYPTSLIDIRANAYNNRGNVYMIRLLQDAAMADFENALKVDPALAAGYLNRGIILQQRFDYVNAKKDFDRSFDILQPGKTANKAYLDFLEEQIKLCDEKNAEAEKLSKVETSAANKKLYNDTGKRLDKLIDDISKAAKADVTAVVHYTKLFVADIYVAAGAVKMNYSNAIYMNDPNEGKVLLHYLADEDIRNAFVRGEKLSELSVYLGSFLPAEEESKEVGYNDELVMWRTYGKDGDGNEACGCSIIIDSKFFTPPVSMVSPPPGENADILCKVIYIKDRGKERQLLDDKESKIKDAIGEFRNQLLNLIKLKSALDPEHAFSVMIDKLVYKKYSKIAYLFKSADYEYEHEVRVVKYVPRNSDTIKCYPVEKKGKPGKLYVESVNPVLPFIQKIYLGPKVADSQHWSSYLDYQIKQRQNEYVLNKMSEFSLNPDGVQIVKSANEFV